MKTLMSLWSVISALFISFDTTDTNLQQTICRLLSFQMEETASRYGR